MRHNEKPAPHDIAPLDPAQLLTNDWPARRSAPDLTRPIMGRLGYMRISPRAARRRRVARWSSRCACIAFAGVAVFLGLKTFQASPDARRPADITMPAAIGSDVEQQQIRFSPLIRFIQQPLFGGGATGAPGSRRFYQHDSAPEGGDPLSPQESHEIDDELNHSAIAPVRWV